jgi:hypothetical protein
MREAAGKCRMNSQEFLWVGNLSDALKVALCGWRCKHHHRWLISGETRAWGCVPPGELQAFSGLRDGKRDFASLVLQT